MLVVLWLEPEAFTRAMNFPERWQSKEWIDVPWHSILLSDWKMARPILELDSNGVGELEG